MITVTHHASTGYSGILTYIPSDGRDLAVAQCHLDLSAVSQRRVFAAVFLTEAAQEFRDLHYS
ncbi:hypothetical protein J6590_070793 [Homalodisca vitripennis]|nr:hypothetical protein J6590_070793 [Homalodisca vitripennis]